jgi:exodeoxyribonuclease-3
MLELEQKKPVILCGDLNVAHRPIDLTHPKANEGNPGYSIEERTRFSELLDEGFIDIFRARYPERVAYTWWSYRLRAREKNVGWRIDYFVVSPKLEGRVLDARIHDQIMGSDHCPVELEIS